MTNRLFTDGGARGNPGPAAVGGVLYQGDKLLADFSKYIGETTNNVAEYQALIDGLELAIKNQVTELDCYLDSKLVVEQVNKNWKIKEAHLQKLFVKVWNLSLKFKKVTFSHVRREQNKEADALVNKALDAQK